MIRGNIFDFDVGLTTNVERIRLIEVRLECLKLGLARHGTNDLRKPLEIADEFYGWVIGSEKDQEKPDLQEPNIAATPSPKGRAAGRKDAPSNSRKE